MLFKYQKNSLSRRDFVKTGLAGGAGLILGKYKLFADEIKPDVWVFHGSDKTKLINSCLEVINKNGGLGKNVKTLALKVNAAWARTPEQGATTHPDLIDAFLKGCKTLGIKNIVLPEHSCHRAKQTFNMSGILKVAKANRASMIDLGSKKKYFIDVNLPEARILKKARVARQFLESDVVINMPVAKHHHGATLTIAMKNWLGAVEDRGFFHRNNLHQCIADLCTLIKPAWTIIDATRIMLDRGPQGPTKNMKYPDLLILSRDQVAADVYTSTLFVDNPLKVEYIKIAGEMHIGQNDLSKITVHKIEVT
jgi:uncharacterized protein (DUF362 family)